MKFLRTQWFSGAMVLLFLLAWIAPGLAAAVNPGDWTKLSAIVLIFFVSGISLPTEQSIKAVSAWRLHLFIQGFNLLLIPAACWLIVKPLADSMPEGLVIGLFLLAAVPTTITSCVVLTQVAGGNTAGALFNAVAGNLVGVFVSPALVMLMLGISDIHIDLDPLRIFLSLGAIVLLPFAAGQFLHAATPAQSKIQNPQSKIQNSTPAPSRLRDFAIAQSGRINRGCILLIVYLAFGDLFMRDAGPLPWGRIILPLALLLPAHLILLWTSHAGAKLARFSRPDRIAILFCAPQKTLSLGLPIASAVLATRPELLGLASLPILVYHSIQLLIGGVLEERLRARARARAHPAPLDSDPTLTAPENTA